ncbi:isochorismatase family protein [Porphyromonas levii]|uniref:nicotinamidase n=1 Tax=Porphyromonas levii TaxID=28114 RepID=A0A4Y8WNL5_9PORP|nr:isochorismatase family protein [Porphyromonas levii]MBR8703488.1 hypothetical protein [Porphyromonas levii]MBR8713695.1 hypothetical protein [Porphyromonas levii]MBR8715696.1 hypothetical protein [Porphyromonas levii]MBR8728256.1 hypothetical protein [Porphyromonas levii]MBR8730041.1 hypothetical protein [Porphyromonas levii]
MKVLIIVDPQNDFITGTLPVAGAKEAMDRLATALPKIPAEEIVVTMDAHPIGHCSFEAQGGMWPPHCVKYSVGAALWEPLMEALRVGQGPVHFIEKGVRKELDEYSAFAKGYPTLLDKAKEVFLCGIAGNVCVLYTLNDLVKHGLGQKLTVITDAAPSLDDGTALKDTIKESGVGVITLEDF